MNKEITMMEVLGRGEEYYGEQYQNAWRNDLALLEKITENCSKEEVEKLYDLINCNLSETMDMIQYIIENN